MSASLQSICQRIPKFAQSNTWQFADDVTQSEVAVTTEAVISKLEETFLRTKNFCQDKRLNINEAKTQLIIFKSAAKRIPDNIVLNLDSCMIKAQPQVKLLGVTLDNHLTMKDHISTTVNTCNGLLGVMRRTTHVMPRDLTKLFYMAMVRSHLEYASSLLIPVAKSHLEKLDIIQRKAARIICQVPSDSPLTRRT